MKAAVNTGATGEYGAHLAHQLLDLARHDLTDLGSSTVLVQQVQADEIDNLAARSFVGLGSDQPTTTAQITGTVFENQMVHLDCLELELLNSKRNWEYAKEQFEGISLMPRVDVPDTIVFASNRTRTVRDFSQRVFKVAGIVIDSRGSVESVAATETVSGKAMLGCDPSRALEPLRQMMFELVLRRNTAYGALWMY